MIKNGLATFVIYLRLGKSSESAGDQSARLLSDDYEGFPGRNDLLLISSAAATTTITTTIAPTIGMIFVMEGASVVEGADEVVRSSDRATVKRLDTRSSGSPPHTRDQH